MKEETCQGSKNALSAVLSSEGRVVGPCREKLKPKGPNGKGEVHQLDKHDREYRGNS